MGSQAGKVKVLYVNTPVLYLAHPMHCVLSYIASRTGSEEATKDMLCVRTTRRDDLNGMHSQADEYKQESRHKNMEEWGARNGREIFYTFRTVV